MTFIVVGTYHGFSIYVSNDSPYLARPDTGDGSTVRLKFTPGKRMGRRSKRRTGMEAQYLGKNKSSIVFVGEGGGDEKGSERETRKISSESIRRAYVNLLNSARYAYCCCTEGSSFLSDGAGRRSRINHHQAGRYRRVNNIQSVHPTDRVNRLHATSTGRSRRYERRRRSSTAHVCWEFSDFLILFR